MAAADAFAEITPTPYTADTPPWQAPDAIHADDLDSYPPGPDPYAGIPPALNAIFETHADAPDASVPPALAPNPSGLPAESPRTWPPKDDD